MKSGGGRVDDVSTANGRMEMRPLLQSFGKNESPTSTFGQSLSVSFVVFSSSVPVGARV
jgi:hypothetical protein